MPYKNTFIEKLPFWNHGKTIIDRIINFMVIIAGAATVLIYAILIDLFFFKLIWNPFRPLFILVLIGSITYFFAISISILKSPSKTEIREGKPSE